MSYQNSLEFLTAISLVVVFITLIILAKVIEDKNIFQDLYNDSEKEKKSMERYYSTVGQNDMNIIRDLKRENEKQTKQIKFLCDQNLILHNEAGVIPETFKSEILTNEKIRKAHENFLEVLQTSK